MSSPTTVAQGAAVLHLRMEWCLYAGILLRGHLLIWHSPQDGHQKETALHQKTFESAQADKVLISVMRTGCMEKQMMPCTAAMNDTHIGPALSHR